MSLLPSDQYQRRLRDDIDFLDAQGQLRSQWWDLSEIQTHISFYVCPHYLQVWKGSDQKQPRKRDNIVFPIISLWEFFPTLKGS